ncbi:MAG: BMP family ABC transporter substrate-binding protein [Eubacteriales bacterium]
MQNKITSQFLLRLVCIITLLVSTALIGCVQTETAITDGISDTEQSPPKIALVVSEITGENAFNYQAVYEFNQLLEDYEFQGSVVEVLDTYGWTEDIRTLCEEGYDYIIGVGWQAANTMPILATSYPDTNFSVIDVADPGTGVKGYSFEIETGCYLLGVMAASAFPEAEIFGYIGNYDDEANGEYLAGYYDGILSINPDATVLTDYINSYTDTDATYEYAIAQAEQGVVFIMGSASTAAHTGLFQAALDLAAKGTPIYVSSTSIDETTSENPYIIGGVTKNTGITVEIAVLDFLNGTLDTSIDEVLTFEDGAFGLVHFGDTPANYTNEEIITEEVLTTVEEAYQSLQ